ncbi:hypothetical protein LTR56_010127 [Elasticomyces elasticus]|nr:hypothetical protein LTR56_010127 [Elasticomyces elasticus]KAK3658881.1 hypothetical protein LTR22_008706 [Elasticomyces elasticus]KAK4923023.1 hypothetical protein LTR49_009685 [Elasticomyces elasticus]KAK5758082.1 hypothetical protein LTS12_011842 [Elasticomyces elasticus]
MLPSPSASFQQIPNIPERSAFLGKLRKFENEHRKTWSVVPPNAVGAQVQVVGGAVVGSGRILGQMRAELVQWEARLVQWEARLAAQATANNTKSRDLDEKQSKLDSDRQALEERIQQFEALQNNTKHRGRPGSTPRANGQAGLGLSTPVELAAHSFDAEPSTVTDFVQQTPVHAHLEYDAYADADDVNARQGMSADYYVPATPNDSHALNDSHAQHEPGEEPAKKRRKRKRKIVRQEPEEPVGKHQAVEDEVLVTVTQNIKPAPSTFPQRRPVPVKIPSYISRALSGHGMLPMPILRRATLDEEVRTPTLEDQAAPPSRRQSNSPPASLSETEQPTMVQDHALPHLDLESESATVAQRTPREPVVEQPTDDEELGMPTVEEQATPPWKGQSDSPPAPPSGKLPPQPTVVQQTPLLREHSILQQGYEPASPTLTQHKPPIIGWFLDGASFSQEASSEQLLAQPMAVQQTPRSREHSILQQQDPGEEPAAFVQQAPRTPFVEQQVVSPTAMSLRGHTVPDGTGAAQESLSEADVSQEVIAMPYDGPSRIPKRPNKAKLDKGQIERRLSCVFAMINNAKVYYIDLPEAVRAMVEQHVKAFYAHKQADAVFILESPPTAKLKVACAGCRAWRITIKAEDLSSTGPACKICQDKKRCSIRVMVDGSKDPELLALPAGERLGFTPDDVEYWVKK